MRKFVLHMYIELKHKESKKCLHILQVVGNHSLPCHPRSNSAVGRSENPKGGQVVMWLANLLPHNVVLWLICLHMGTYGNYESHFSKKPYFYQKYLSYKVSICENVWILGGGGIFPHPPAPTVLSMYAQGDIPIMK